MLSLRKEGAPLLSVFGGKITTHRKLAEAVIHKLSHYFPQAGGDWTATSTLPGGDFPVAETAAMPDRLARDYPFLDHAAALRLIRSYGSECWDLLGNAKTPADLGRHFGAGLYEAEVRWLMEKEFARTAEDIVFRRTKRGLRMSADEIAALDDWMNAAG